MPVSIGVHRDDGLEPAVRSFSGVSAPTGFEREESPVVVLLDAIVRAAALRGASDIHLEPSQGGGRVRERVNGSMHVARTITGDIFERIVARLKLLAGMDVADRRQPQDGRCALECGGVCVDARVASLPTPDGEKLVVRLLDGDPAHSSLEALGMEPAMLRRFRALIRRPYGCIVVAGPTGSGKTTTLYASLADLDGEVANLCSIEDPIERRIPQLTQVQINERAGLDFAAVLRAIVRQDPDALMIGEIRDAETAHAVTGAALAGHLVLTSIHAGDGEGALERLVELGISRRSLATAITAVVSQRLVRRSMDGHYGARIGVFELALLDERGRIRAEDRGGLARAVATLVDAGSIDVAEARRAVGDLRI